MNNKLSTHKKIFLYIVFLSVFNSLFLCQQTFSAQSEIDRCISKLEKSYETMKDFHSAFEQETHQGSIKIVQKAKGNVYFKKGGKMLWDYKTPETQKIILDGKNLWFYLPEEKQVMKNNFSTIPDHIVLDLFNGKINIQQKFKVTFIQNVSKDGKTETVIELIPIIYNPTLIKLVLWLDPKTYFVSKSSLEDEFGNKTILRFLNIEIDKGIDDSMFDFVPPPGVDVFEPPRLQ